MAKTLMKSAKMFIEFKGKNMKTLNKKMDLKFLFILTLSVSISILSVRIPFIAKNMLDYALEMNFNSIKNSALILILTISGILLVELLRKITMTSYKKDLFNVIREKITKGLLNRDFEKFYERKNQEYISIYNNEIPEVVNNYYMQFIDIMFDFFSIIIFSISLFALHPLMAIVVLTTNAIPLLIPVFYKNKLNFQKDEYFKSLKEYNICLGDIINGFLNIKTNNAQNNFKYRADNLSKLSNQKMQKYENTSSKSQLLIGLFSYFNYFSIILLGVYLITKGVLTAGGLIAAVGVSEMLVGPVTNISYELNIFNSLKNIKKSLFKEFSMLKDEKPKIVLNKEIEKIEIKNVDFFYADKQALKKVNFTFEKNKKYLIYGNNGSGKSTLFKLISKIYETYTGDILINGISLKTIEEKSYFEKIGIVFQTPMMFNDTLKENMMLYSEINDEKIKEVINTLNLDRIQNQIFENKSFKDSENNISGGEMQKINISRVLLKEKNFLILDEFTSSFDKKSSFELEKNLLENKNITLLNIQHNLNKELLKYYDEIIFIENGSIQKENKLYEEKCSKLE